MANELSVSLIEPVHKVIPKFARVQFNQEKPEIWLGRTSGVFYPMPFKEFGRFIRRHANYPAEFSATFYLDQIEQIAQRVPIYLEPDGPCDARVIKCEENDNPFSSPYEIRVLKTKDEEALLHEILHLCCDTDIERQKESEDAESLEESIEIAMGVIARDDKDVFNRIKRTSINAVIKNYQLERFKIEGLEELLSFSRRYKTEFERLNDYFFLDELREQLSPSTLNLT